MTASVDSNAKSRKATKGARRRVAAGKAATFDRSKYATLLSRALPMVITTKAEYDQKITEKTSMDEAFSCLSTRHSSLGEGRLPVGTARPPQTEIQAPRENQKQYGRSSQPKRGRVSRPVEK